MSEFEPTPDVESPPVVRRTRPKLPQWPNYILMIGLGLALFGAGLLTGWYVWGRTEVADAAPQAAVPQNTEAETTGQQIQIPEELTRYEISISGYPVFGPDDAEITLVEFSDYQCPYCKRWHDEVFARLMAEYDGKIKFVYRNLPVIRENSADAARASYCAEEQGAYWEYHEALFSNRYDFSEQSYEQYALDLGLDAPALMDCYNSGRYAEIIEADLQFARSMGIGSTPTFFLNGIPVVGAQPYDIFQQIIELELAGQLPGRLE